MELTCKQKCLVRYLFERCDNIGIWEPNFIIASVHIGEKVTAQEIEEIDGGRQFEFLDNGKVFIKDFCDFQYGELTENCKPHLPIISKLKKLGLFERVSKGYSKGIHTLEEKEQEKDKKKKKTGKGSGENHIVDESASLRSEYTELQESFGEKDLPTVGLELKTFIETKQPTFAEPYVDAWNLFARKKGLTQVKMITDARRDKIRIRTREPGFRFFDILTAAGKNKFYMGDDGKWKLDFDHIIESENNYVKILERK